jgi:membrane protein
LPLPKRALIKSAKIAIRTGQSFSAQRLGIRASGLTLYSLLSLVPVLALMFGIAKGFGLETRLQSWITSQFHGQQEVLEYLIVFARRMLSQTKGGLVAGAGVAFLLYTVIRVIGYIEQAFNTIWSVGTSRSLTRKFSDYLSLILVGPFLILGAASLNVYIAAMVHRAAESAPLSQFVGPLVALALRFAPLAMVWVLFTFLYLFLPNTRVRIGSALVGGAVAGIVFQMVQTLYIELQIGVSSNNAVYGSFAALPLFIIWLQISWHIVLLGAELTHQHQTFESGEMEEPVPNLSFRAVKRLALAVVKQVVLRFVAGRPPPTSEEISLSLQVSARMLQDVLNRLTQARILAITESEEDGMPGYLPARDVRLITPFLVFQALESLGEDPEGAAATGGDFDPVFEAFEHAQNERPENRPLDAPPGNGIAAAPSGSRPFDLR